MVKQLSEMYFVQGHNNIIQLIEYFEDGHLELYNLQHDPSEKNNLAEEEPKRRRELHELLKSWRKETKAPVPTMKNPRFKSS